MAAATDVLTEQAQKTQQQNKARNASPPPVKAKAAEGKVEKPQLEVNYRGPSLAVLTVIAFVAATLRAEPAQPGAVLPWTLNPAGHGSMALWIGLYVVSVPAKEVMDYLLNLLGNSLGLKKMDDGDVKVRKLEKLEAIDLSYLTLNTMIEYIGMNHIYALLISQYVTYPLAEFNVWNGPVAFFLLMLLNDVIYCPWHIAAHERNFYPFVHKQHHRNFFPFRGYADAANQHPIEQWTGFSIFCLCLIICSATVGMHAGTAWCATLAWALFNVGNHLAFDSTLHLPLPYPAFPRDHSMHHRILKCNYSTLTTIMDRLFGTYLPYQAPQGVKLDEADFTGGRPEAVPSQWSVIGFGIWMFICALAAEALSTHSAPNALEAAQVFLPASGFLAAAAAGCAASGSIASALTKKKA
eukprot:TRINITY_DN2238_c0_g1_i1.p1 TRINITY_DN2238_c0_g1~~TRINITY_DN2238_c0_g1_i1.p1  ORF type:complete len:410 (-),score=114.01 TRINITY_DN2238_c0_g1_i1:111-1340(-)